MSVTIGQVLEFKERDVKAKPYNKKKPYKLRRVSKRF